MSERSPQTLADVQQFLAMYTWVVDYMLQMAGGAFTQETLAFLAQDPYRLPPPLQRMPGADQLTGAFRTLVDLRSRIDDADVDREVLEILRVRAMQDASNAYLRAVEAIRSQSAQQSLMFTEKHAYPSGPPTPPEAPKTVEPNTDSKVPSRTTRESEPAPGPHLDPRAAQAGGPPGSGGGSPPPGAQTHATDVQTNVPERWVNAEIEDHVASEPLDPSRTYTVAFGVDIEKKASAVATARLADELLFPAGVEEVVLTVQLDSEDFDISDRTRPLRIPRAGQSRGKARFDITPKHVGRRTLKATLHKDGNFIQQLEITVSVGPQLAQPVQVAATGRPPAAAAVLQPRDIGLSIVPAPAGGYDCTVWGAVAARAHLPVQQAELAGAIDALRQELMGVIMQVDASGTLVFQTGIDIPAPIATTVLRTMANAGALLFDNLFYHPAAGPDARLIGNWLREKASDPATRLKLQIVSATTPIPWDLLYVGDASDSAVLDWDRFLGMRHIIEQIPLQTTLSISDSNIPSDNPSLAVSLNLNSGIDTQFGMPLVRGQQDYWDKATASRHRLRVTPRTTSKQLVDALSNAATDDQILYFYCHAATVGLGPGSGGPNKSSLTLTDASVTLGDLNRNAPATVQLRGMPLVFINACESAELSPAFYDGFVPYFMNKGARGVIGTECKTPGFFAAKWADLFFDRFLDGSPLGETFLSLRRDFLKQHNNPLGLLYTVHCDADTRILPALAVPAA